MSEYILLGSDIPYLSFKPKFALIDQKLTVPWNFQYTCHFTQKREKCAILTILCRKWVSLDIGNAIHYKQVDTFKAINKTMQNMSG